VTDHHRHDRGRVIGLLLGACVLVGGAGAAGGVVFDPAPASGSEVVQPGAVAMPSGHGMHAAVGPAADDLTGGSVVTLEGGVPVVVPAGWEVTGQRTNNVSLADGKGSFAYALTGRANPGSSATGLLAANIPVLLPPETYTQQLLVDYGELQPFGSVVSAAYTEYEALVADNQGSLSLHGQIYVGVRQDNLVLLLLVEHTPAEEWNEEGVPATADLVNGSFSLFAGLG
jgi:hypothetical protein